MDRKELEKALVGAYIKTQVIPGLIVIALITLFIFLAKG